MLKTVPEGLVLAFEPEEDDERCAAPEPEAANRLMESDISKTFPGSSKTNREFPSMAEMTEMVESDNPGPGTRTKGIVPPLGAEIRAVSVTSGRTGIR